MAKLYFRYGAMNSGKSTALLQVAFNYEERGQTVVIVKPAIDSKGDNNIVSRAGLERKVDFLLGAGDDVYSLVDNVDVVLVDEAQFLEPEQVDGLLKLVVRKNIPVIAYGLRTDFKVIGFPGAVRLLEIAHTIEELKTICRCGSKALFNARMVDGIFTITGDQVAIDGGNITYESFCADCYDRRVVESV